MLRTLLALSLVLSTGSTAFAEPKIVGLPSQFTLAGPKSFQRVVVQSVTNGAAAGQVRSGVEFTSSDPKVVVIENGIALPKGNGEAIVTVKADGLTAETKVTVSGLDKPSPWSFRHDVLPILSKAGCNSGACHGALAGKGGFRLSLRGYDPVTDHFTIVKQDRGRRIELADPGRSLLIAKPSGAIPHKGGVRFDTDSADYRILAEWIAAGAPAPVEADPQVTRLEVLPERAVLENKDAEQLIVRAHFSDGTSRDATPWVKWSSANEAVARVDDNGLVSIVGHGEGAIVAWYSSRLVIARVTVPYPQEIAPAAFAQKPRNVLDELIDTKLKSLNIPPSPPSSDAEFIRRVYLDTIGTLPTSDETKAFLADSTADKRDKLIDALLARPEFVDYWTYRTSDILMLNGTLLRPDALKAYYQWIRKNVEANTPWDQFVREILTATGSSVENGATNFYALHQDPENMTENACQAFLGLSIACAKCHNHPLEKWTNDQYYSMANLFARVRAKGWGGEPRNGDGKRTLYVSDTGDLIQPRTGKPQPPMPLDGTPIPFDETTDRRIHLAKWMTAPDNPYFARSITNRIWKNYFGVGLVEQVDDMRASNPASNEELLNAAAKHLVDNKFNLKALMKLILQSNAYQRTSEPQEANKSEQRFYSRYYPKRLMAEVMHDAVCQVAEVPSDFNMIAFPGADKQKTDFYPKGTRAIQLYDSAVDNYFLQAFGRNQRRITCECERSDEPSMVQVLHIANGDTINQKLKSPGSRVEKLLKLESSGMSPETLIDETYLCTVSRYPTAAERASLLAVLNQTPESERRAAVEDLFWAILSSREFLFNH